MTGDEKEKSKMEEGASSNAVPKRSATVATHATTATNATTTTTGTNATSRSSDDEVIPDSDHNNSTTVLLERLQAWKHMCGYLENYVSTTQKVQRAQSKEFEKILKTVSEPLKEGHHFIQGNGGIVSLFDTLRNNTRGLSNMHLETEKSLKSTVHPVLEDLLSEIKKKIKELKSGSVKASKNVAKARTNTQKHIELLGQYAASFDTNPKARIESSHDPYLLSRGVYHRLHKQIEEENNHLQEILTVQNTFAQFESHVIETVQDALNKYFQCMGGQADRQRAMFAEIAATAQQVPPDFEWANFYERNDASLINPNTPQRSMTSMQFPNQEHSATTPLISGMLDRKSRAMVKGYSAGFYVITQAGYLHGFKDNDDYKQDPSPDISLYLPECTVGAFEGLRFSIKGKDVSGGKVGNALTMSTELNFKAHTMNDAESWQSVLTNAAFAKGATGSSPTSPAVSRSVSGAQQPLSPVAQGKEPESGESAEAGPARSPSTKTSETDKQEDGVVETEGDKKSAS